MAGTYDLASQLRLSVSARRNNEMTSKGERCNEMMRCWMCQLNDK